MKPRPDFSKMTPDEIRGNISSLNREIRDLRKLGDRNIHRFFKGQVTAVGCLLPALAAPPAVVGVCAAGLVHGGAKLSKQVDILGQLHEKKKLRAQFKAVWRARPGKPVYDIEARAKREQARAKKPARKFPFPAFWRKK